MFAVSSAYNPKKLPVPQLNSLSAACRKMACRKINEDVGYARNTKSGSKGAVTLYEVRLDTVLDSRFRIRNVESGIRTLFMTLEIIHFINVQLINVGKN